MSDSDHQHEGLQAFDTDNAKLKQSAMDRGRQLNRDQPYPSSDRRRSELTPRASILNHPAHNRGPSTGYLLERYGVISMPAEPILAYHIAHEHCEQRVRAIEQSRASAPTMASSSMSPSSSPRLPSPPPFPEVQISPQSPGMNATSGSAQPEARDPSVAYVTFDRIRPGTKAADMARGPPLVPLEEIDSPYALQIMVKALWHHHTNGSEPKNRKPITRETAQIIVNPPAGVDRSLWLYELCRWLVQKTNDIIVAFQNDTPPCTYETCPEMRASEWQYLCAVHDPPKSCCAKDYCDHTLDWAANTLTSQKHFPSRLTLGSDGSGGKQAAERQITNIFRRVYRIYAHAWFQHRNQFWKVENKWGHYILFKTVCDVYALIPVENYTIPAEAEGPPLYGPERPPAISQPASTEEAPQSEEGDTTTTISTGDTTRRHRHTPSTGSAVTVIHEDEEDEPESQPKVREQPAELRDPLTKGDGGESKANEQPNDSTLDKALEDFTISEPVEEKGTNGKEGEDTEKVSTEGEQEAKESTDEK